MHSRFSLALKQAYTCFTAPSRWIKWREQVFPHTNRLAKASHWRVKQSYQLFPTHKQACTSRTGPPQWWKLLSRSSLAHKHACTCFTAPPRQLKRRYQVFPAHRQACTSLIVPIQWRKMLSRSSLALKHAYTCFTASPRRLKPLYKDFPNTNMLALSSHGLHSGENCFPDQLWNLKRPPRASHHLLKG